MSQWPRPTSWARLGRTQYLDDEVRWRRGQPRGRLQWNRQLWRPTGRGIRYARQQPWMRALRPDVRTYLPSYYAIREARARLGRQQPSWRQRADDIAAQFALEDGGDVEGGDE